MKIQTAEFQLEDLDAQQQEWVYNSLDCCVTAECLTAIKAETAEFTYPTYNFVRGMQAPAMLMSLRGIRVDRALRDAWIADLEKRLRRLQWQLDEMATAVWDKPLNSQSPKQLQDFLYGVMQLPPQTKYDKVRKMKVVSVDRSALEKLAMYFRARPIITTILLIRDLSKRCGTLRTAIDSDSRMRTAYNVCGTETGRWSSNENAFSTGTNLQNWEDKLREILIADKGKKFAYIDGEQAESRVVAYISGDEKYIEACEGGDLHTTVATMVWPDMKWSADPKENKEIAGEKFYRDFSYRDLAKRGGHGTNYRGKPPTMAKHLHVDVRLMEDFQRRYFAAFPGIQDWHHRVACELQLTGKLVTPLGRVRHFQGRLDSDDTLKEAIAFLPQSTIGEIVNEGLYRVWRDFELTAREDGLSAELIAQLHDAILIQFPDISDEFESAVIREVRKTMEIPIPINGRTLIIPANCEGTGWNWRKYNAADNEQGLKKWTGHETRRRVETPDTMLSRILL